MFFWGGVGGEGLYFRIILMLLLQCIGIYMMQLAVGVCHCGVMRAVHSYRKEHADDLVQMVFFKLLEVQWVNPHDLLPLESSWHLGHRATESTVQDDTSHGA